MITSITLFCLLFLYLFLKKSVSYSDPLLINLSIWLVFSLILFISPFDVLDVLVIPSIIIFFGSGIFFSILISNQKYSPTYISRSISNKLPSELFLFIISSVLLFLLIFYSTKFISLMVSSPDFRSYFYYIRSTRIHEGISLTEFGPLFTQVKVFSYLLSILMISRLSSPYLKNSIFFKVYLLCFISILYFVNLADGARSEALTYSLSYLYLLVLHNNHKKLFITLSLFFGLFLSTSTLLRGTEAGIASLSNNFLLYAFSGPIAFKDVISGFSVPTSSLLDYINKFCSFIYSSSCINIESSIAGFVPIGSGFTTNIFSGLAVPYHLGGHLYVFCYSQLLFASLYLAYKNRNSSILFHLLPLLVSSTVLITVNEFYFSNLTLFLRAIVIYYIVFSLFTVKNYSPMHKSPDS